MENQYMKRVASYVTDIRSARRVRTSYRCHRKDRSWSENRPVDSSDESSRSNFAFICGPSIQPFPNSIYGSYDWFLSSFPSGPSRFPIPPHAISRTNTWRLLFCYSGLMTTCIDNCSHPCPHHTIDVLIWPATFFWRIVRPDLPFVPRAAYLTAIVRVFSGKVPTHL